MATTLSLLSLVSELAVRLGVRYDGVVSTITNDTYGIITDTVYRNEDNEALAYWWLYYPSGGVAQARQVKTNAQYDHSVTCFTTFATVPALGAPYYLLKPPATTGRLVLALNRALRVAQPAAAVTSVQLYRPPYRGLMLALPSATQQVNRVEEAGPELVENADFHEGTLLRWLPHANSSLAATVDGPLALRHTVTGAGEVDQTARWLVSRGGLYTVGGLLAAAPGGVATLWLRWFDAAGTPIGTDVQVGQVTTTTPTRVSVEYLEAPASAVEAEFRFTPSGVGSHWLYYVTASDANQRFVRTDWEYDPDRQLLSFTNQLRRDARVWAQSYNASLVADADTATINEPELLYAHAAKWFWHGLGELYDNQPQRQAELANWDVALRQITRATWRSSPRQLRRPRCAGY